MITARNANTFDFVLPRTGDPTANYRAPDLSPSGTAAPIYVVDRTDIVRIFVDVPEQDANFVHIGTKATVLVKGYRDEPIPATVTRTSWALNMKSRTLRAEIDLPNPGSQLLPGMYAYVKVIIERPDVRALPESAVTYSGDKAYYWTLRERTCGADRGPDGGRRRRVDRGHESAVLAKAEKGEDPWVPIDGTEQVILGDLSLLTDGVPVEVAPATEGRNSRARCPRPDLWRRRTMPSASHTTNSSQSRRLACCAVTPRIRQIMPCTFRRVVPRAWRGACGSVAGEHPSNQRRPA